MAPVFSGQPVPSVESICRTKHRHTVTSFFSHPVLIFLSSSLYYFTPFFLIPVSDRARGCDGSRPSKDEGWGSRWQFQFDANDLCTIQGQRMICEACAPTHTSIHNLVLDYISI